jgi:superoxide reductase
MQPVEAIFDSAEHTPIIESTPGTLHIQVGTPPHPMEEDHYIQWIEVIEGGKAYRQYLQPGQAPNADFKVTKPGAKVQGRCSRHGLWRK